MLYSIRNNVAVENITETGNRVNTRRRDQKGENRLFDFKQNAWNHLKLSLAVVNYIRDILLSAYVYTYIL